MVWKKRVEIGCLKYRSVCCICGRLWNRCLGYIILKSAVLFLGPPGRDENDVEVISGVSDFFLDKRRIF